MIWILGLKLSGSWRGLERRERSSFSLIVDFCPNIIEFEKLAFGELDLHLDAKPNKYLIV